MKRFIAVNQIREGYQTISATRKTDRRTALRRAQAAFKAVAGAVLIVVALTACSSQPEATCTTDTDCLMHGRVVNPDGPDYAGYNGRN